MKTFNFCNIKGVLFWNIALDQNTSPKLGGVDTTGVNRGFLTIRSDTMDSVNFEASYYSMGHSSKFVLPGAYRIDSTNFQDALESVAYLNPDNTIVVVLSNRGSSSRTVRISWNGKYLGFSMTGYETASLKWKA
jgi:glucosylceramidase